MALADQRLGAARTIAVDVATAEVVAALREAGVRSLLLKGPALARLLYDAGELRPYVDVDLLVAPDDEERAGAVLTGLGYAILVADAALAGHRPLHAHEWTGPVTSVDLHRTLPGASASPAAVAEALRDASIEIEVAGVRVEALGPAALALQAALHAAHHGPREEKPLADLERAVARLPEATWRDAAALADRIGAAGAFAAGVRLAPGGPELAARLGLPSRAPIEVTLRAGGAPPLAVGLDWLLRTPGLRAKAALVARTAVPAPGAMRLWRPLARRRPLGLVAAYLSHPFWLARHAVPSLLAVRDARKEVE